MNCLFLIALLFAAPIPKGDRESTIVAVKSYPEPLEIIVLKSNGTIIKRFHPNGCERYISGIRLDPTGKKIIVTSYEGGRPNLIAGRNYLVFSGFLIDLEKTDEPAKPVFEKLLNVGSISWSSDGSKIYFSDLDEEKLKAAKAEDPMPFRSWTLDLKTGKKEALKIPEHQRIIGLTNDGKQFLTGQIPSTNNVNDYAKARAFITPLDTLKPKLISDVPCMPMNISPDGKSVIGYRYTEEPDLGRRVVMNYFTLNVESREIQQLRAPASGNFTLRNPIWINAGKNIATLMYEQNIDSVTGNSSIQYQIQFANRQGDNFKKVIAFEPRESIVSFDCR